MQEQPREDFSNNTNQSVQISGNKNNLNKGQKIAAASLAVFAFLILIFWGLQFQKTIISPFRISGNTAETSDTSANTVDNEVALKSKDTDKDGLSDWDELYTYKTSPYLDDSDSDGYSDKVEIENGKDPNCPNDRDCTISGVVDGDASVTQNSEESSDELSQYLNQELNTQVTQESTANLSESEIMQKILDGTIDPSTLRQLMIERGATKEMLDKISDEQLMANLKATLNSTASTTGNTP